MTQTEHCNSEKVQKLHQKICQLKANKQMEAKFMQAWEEKVLERQEAYEEGKQAGTRNSGFVWKIDGVEPYERYGESC